MTSRLRRKHRTTAFSIRRAKRASARAWAGSLTAALVLCLAAATPGRAELKTEAAKDASRAKSANSSLKWRSPKTIVTTESAADQGASSKNAASSATTAKPAPAEKSSASQSAPRKFDLDKVFDDEPASAESSQVKAVVKDAPAEVVTEPTAKPITTEKVSRTPVTVARLGDAEPSPHSTTTLGSTGSTLTIKLASHEEPQIDPFGEDQAPALQMATKPAREKTVQAAMQQRRSSAAQDPFGDAEPPLEQVPALAPPQEPTEPSPPSELAQALPYNCPTPREYVKKLSDISTNIAAEPGEFPVECGLGDEQFVPRSFQNTLFAWKASSLCHKPLYFEDVELERYGQTCSPLFQPILSAAKFYLTLPILPYKMGLETPCECIYPLGYYRPGSCAPFIIPPVPISLRGALLEAGVWVAGVALVP